MGWFADVATQAARNAAKGFDWGTNAAFEGWAATRDLVTKAAAAVQQQARNTVGSAAAAAAQKATAKAVADKQRFDAMRSKLDQRDRYSSKVVEPCPNPLTTHPDKRDGQFMGADCPTTQIDKPVKGVKPDGCDCGKGGQALPKVMFTNGINNTPGEVCKTMHALANSRCVEVTSVFNATYRDPNVRRPTRDWAAYKNDAVSGAVNALKGMLGGDGAAGALGQAGASIALREAGRFGLIEDIVDCIDTINKGGAEAASYTLGREIVTALNGKPPQMTIYAHSQGGLNAGEAIAQAKKNLEAVEKDRLLDLGVVPAEAKVAAQRFAASKLAGLQVNTFGTLERGLPDGPQYNRFTNDYDPVPQVIREAQKGLTPELVTRDPLGAPPVQTFAAAPSIDPMAAHGMNEAYLPWLTANRPVGPCC